MNKLFIFCFIFCLPYCLAAQYFSTPSVLVPYMENAPEIVSRAAVLIDAQTGALLYSKNADDEIPPASLTKLMTMHLIMNEINAGRASYDELIPITVESGAQSQPPRSSLMFLEPGQRVTLREILLGLAVSSGNDAAVAAALRLAPDMESFANLMTAEARRMGLNITRFTESSGYSSDNMTTAEEFAFFCYQYIRLHPDSLNDFHSVQTYSFPLADNVPERRRNNFQTVTQNSNNSLLRNFPGTDGLKTGFIPDSGYNIALTAEREKTRFILVLLGAPSQPGGGRIREADGIRVLTWAFDNFKTVRPDIPPIENARLWKGRENSVRLKLASSVYFTAPIERTAALSFETIIPEPLTAPLPENHSAGYLVVSDESGELSRFPLVTAGAYERGNVFKRIWHSILLLFNRGN